MPFYALCVSRSSRSRPGVKTYQNHLRHEGVVNACPFEDCCAVVEEVLFQVLENASEFVPRTYVGASKLLEHL
jgi:hypothetical protein